MRKQRGVTMIGWIFLLVPVGIVLYAGIRVAPEYYEYFKLVSAVEKTAEILPGEETPTPANIRRALQARFDAGYVDDVKAKDLEITRGEEGWNVVIDYDSTIPLFFNVYLTLDFDKTVVFPVAGT
jgi:hypothetical protein